MTSSAKIFNFVATLDAAEPIVTLVFPVAAGDKCHLAFEFSAHCDRSLFGRVEGHRSGKGAHAISGGQKTSARTSMLSRGAALDGLFGSSNDVCAVKRARPSSRES
jgi:hypothetical protein